MKKRIYIIFTILLLVIIVIRYNNNSMFKNHEIHIPFKEDVDGFEWARLIQKLKI